MNDAAIAELINRREELRDVRGKIWAEALHLYPYKDEDRGKLDLLEALHASVAAMEAKSRADIQRWMVSMCEGLNDG